MTAVGGRPAPGRIDLRTRLLAAMLSLVLVLTNVLVFAPPKEAEAAPEMALGTTFYFAEGATTPPFDTWLLLYNPGATAGSALITYFVSGAAQTQTVALPANSRQSIFVNQVLPNAAFGTQIVSTVPIAAERAMYFRGDGTAVTGIPTPSNTWYFGEGATAAPHQTWFLMLNPNNAATTATLTFFFEAGGSQQTQVTIPPFSRASIFTNQILPPAAFSTEILSTLPIVAERSMFKTSDGSGAASQGAVQLQNQAFFAEGSTFAPFDTWFLLANTTQASADVTVQYFRDNGPPVTQTLTVPPLSRRSIFVNQILPNANFGAIFTVGGNANRVVVERSMFKSTGGSLNSVGTTAASTVWYLAEGSTAPPFDEWVLLSNPNNAVATATLTFSFPNGTSSTRTVTIPANGRTSLFLNQLLPATAVSTRVNADRPIVVERSMYFRQGGTNVIGNQQ